MTCERGPVGVALGGWDSSCLRLELPLISNSRFAGAGVCGFVSVARFSSIGRFSARDDRCRDRSSASSWRECDGSRRERRRSLSPRFAPSRSRYFESRRELWPFSWTSRPSSSLGGDLLRCLLRCSRL